ncbi:DUF4411 family protein [Polynucleobacter victoriensis]|uniref:PIN domain-containing protein n=1 Tax=Polynucleobacter victoriensis TaxID=2049319 RepID=A0A212U1I9_9BURK|nr:DUF4411 family protein [Polynucleobacter victoriensis]SNC71996.1 protein of unknown function [Polynucleobacter victoriensis]
MKYCIDTSSLIDLGERHYPEKLAIFKPIWTGLYTGISNGDIISVDLVKVELEKRADDWRTNFCAKSADMFKMSQEIEQQYAKLVSLIEVNPKFPKNSARDRFFEGADLFLISLAMCVDDGVVVTSETKNLSNYGLRPVCNELGVKNMNLVEFFEAYKLGISRFVPLVSKSVK